MEQELGVAAVELDVAEFVNTEQVETAVAGEAAFVGGFNELATNWAQVA